ERINPKFLTGLLNSNVVAFWLKNKGKMQGQNYQIDKGPILTIPIAIPSISLQESVAGYVDQIYSSNDSIELESHINQLIYDIYGISSSDAAVIEATIQ
nr:hypothetical protein [bacterium]